MIKLIYDNNICIISKNILKLSSYNNYQDTTQIILKYCNDDIMQIFKQWFMTIDFEKLDMISDHILPNIIHNYEMFLSSQNLIKLLYFAYNNDFDLLTNTIAYVLKSSKQNENDKYKNDEYNENDDNKNENDKYENDKYKDYEPFYEIILSNYNQHNIIDLSKIVKIDDNLFMYDLNKPSVCQTLKELDTHFKLNNISSKSFSEKFKRLSSPKINDDNNNFEGIDITNLKTLIIPPNITKINAYEFAYYTQLTNVIFLESSNSVFNKIDDHAFEYCIKLKSISLPKSIEYIGQNAFANCYELSKIIIPDDHYIHISKSAFSQCALTSLIINSHINVINNSYINCDYLKSIDIPDYVEQISDYAFYNCCQLSSITIPSSVTYIGYRAFENCYKLENIILSEGLEYIDKEAFNYVAITSMTIPKSLKYINEYAFEYCKINELIIDNPELRISSFAFSNIDELTRIEIINIKNIQDCAFYGCKNIKSINIPKKFENMMLY